MNYHAPPPHVLDALERGDSGALQAMHNKAAQTRRKNAERRQIEKRKEEIRTDALETAEDVLRDREAHAIAERLAETNEDIIPLDTYD